MNNYPNNFFIPYWMKETLKQNNNISLSSLLNIFDGINTPDGSICIFTTNHIEKLDSAFLRDGRMDFKMEIGEIGKKEIIDFMAKNLISSENIKKLKQELFDNVNILPSKCQKILMEQNIEEAILEINKNIKST